MIKEKVKEEKEFDYHKTLALKSKSEIVYAEIDKTLYIAQKEYYKQKLKSKNRKG